MFRVIFMGIIAVFLLALYAYATFFAINLLNDTSFDPKTALPADNPLSLLTFTGGLVSALVISVLAITPPNQSPGTTLIAANQQATDQPISATATTIVQVLTYVYLAVWLICGMSSVLYVFRPDNTHAVPELTAAAKSWLGLAVASAYAFFGLKTTN